MAEDVNTQSPQEQAKFQGDSIPPAHLPKVVELVSGKGADNEKQRWVRENLLTTREAVQNGKHDSLLYLASGGDGLRTLVGYDVSDEIVVDTDDDFLGTTQKQLEYLGIESTTVSSPDGTQQTVAFEMDGKKRVVTEVRKDARLVKISDFGHETVDIFHIYAPTGADTPLDEADVYYQKRFGTSHPPERYDPDFQKSLENDADSPQPNESGNYNTVVPAIERELSPDNYRLVSEKGFFVFGERRIAPSGFSPALLEIAGLEEKRIVKRHPYTVSTSLFPSEEEVQSMDRTGYIYQKARTVPSELITPLKDGIDISYGVDYRLNGFERGDFSLLQIEGISAKDIRKGVETTYAELLKNIEDVTQQFASLGISSALMERYRAETLADFRQRIKHLQSNFGDLITQYDTVSEKMEQGTIDDEHALEEMGIVILDKPDKSTGRQIVNTKWSLASSVVLDNPQQEEVYTVVSQFANTDFDFLTDNADEEKVSEVRTQLDSLQEE